MADHGTFYWNELMTRDAEKAKAFCGATLGWTFDAMPSGGEAPSCPLTFLQMALLQWVNPKAWAVALTVTVAFTTPANYAASLLLMTLVFGIVNLPSVSVWAVFGSMLRNMLRDPVKVRAFNLLMAVMLVASMLPIVFDLAP